LNFGTQSDGGTTAPQTVTLTSSGCTGSLRNGSYSFGAGNQPFSRAGFLQGPGSCGNSGNITLAVDASCTINVLYSPSTGQTGAVSRTLTIGGLVGGTLSGSPVTLTGTAQSTPGTLTFSSATGGTLATVFGARALTFTIPSSRSAATAIVTVSNSGGGPLAITADSITMSANLFSVSGTTCSLTTPLAAGGTCTFTLAYATPGTRPSFPHIGGLAVSHNGANANAGTNSLVLSGQ
jgi:hypothetical protein